MYIYTWRTAKKNTNDWGLTQMFTTLRALSVHQQSSVDSASSWTSHRSSQKYFLRNGQRIVIHVTFCGSHD